jgi:serine/threonine-protein kinase
MFAARQMTIERLQGALIARYEVQRELGAGGMATVYLARDLRHERRVALKVLRPELAAVIGAERFLQEIKTTANLQHPHILGLIDSGEANGLLWYVMPYVEGESLRDRLEREKQLPVDEAIRLTTEVAGALDYAHRHGVIHRDIKPENILLHDRRALVADFGIALAVSSAGASRMTETGMSLGTPQYMSPEQAMGDRTLDARSDVYSLGAMLYEMLAGDPPYTGSTAQAIVAKVLTEKAPPVTAARDTVPLHVAAAIQKSLAKLPADRFPSAAEFASALADTTYRGTVQLAAAREAPSGRRAVYTAGAIALIAGVAAAWGWMRPRPDLPVTRLDLSTGAVTPSNGSDLVISPDGSMLALSGTLGGERAIFLRRLDGDAAFRKVPGTESGTAPSFSPDNEWIVFRRNSDRSLVKVAVAGGGSVTLVATGGLNPFAPAWAADGQITFTSPQGTYRIPAGGGSPVHLAAPTRSSFMLPDGSGMLTTTGAGISVYDFASDSATMLIPNASHGWYVETGHLLYVAEGDGLFAVPFELGRHRITGPPVRIVERVGQGNLARGYSVSKTGTLVIRDGPSLSGTAGATATRLLIVGFDRAVDTVHLPRGRRLLPRFSPDGRSIAFEIQTLRGGGETDIHTFDLVTGKNTELTSEGDNDDPIWSPDGRRILFAKETSDSAEDLYVKPADNSGAQQTILTAPGNQNPTGWLADETILFQSHMPGVPSDLYTLPAGSSGRPRAYLQAPWPEWQLQVSSDGKLASFTAAEGGTNQVWLRDFPDPKGKWLVSPGGGDFPRWSPDGRYIYYWTQGLPLDTLFRARVDRTPGIVVRAPEVMATIAAAGIANWDIHPDGRRFIVAVADNPVAARAGTPEDNGPAKYLVVLNWFTELKKLTAKGAR